MNVCQMHPVAPVAAPPLPLPEELFLCDRVLACWFLVVSDCYLAFWWCKQLPAAWDSIKRLVHIAFSLDSKSHILQSHILQVIASAVQALVGEEVAVHHGRHSLCTLGIRLQQQLRVMYRRKQGSCSCIAHVPGWLQEAC